MGLFGLLLVSPSPSSPLLASSGSSVILPRPWSIPGTPSRGVDAPRGVMMGAMAAFSKDAILTGGGRLPGSLRSGTEYR